MTQDQIMKKLNDNKDAFFAKIENDVKATGSFECQCSLCDCPVKERITPTTMQVFVTPPPELKVEAICLTGMLKYCEKYNIPLPINIP